MSEKLPSFKVVLTDPGWPDFKCEQAQLGDLAEFQRFNCKTEEQVILNCADAHALLVTYAPITRRVIAELKQCRVISIFGIGVDMVDLPAATEAGVRVTNVPGYCVEEVCDHAMALLLAAARKIVFFHQGLKEDGQWKWRAGMPIYRLRGKTLGLLGFGKIPRAVAVRAMSFGLQVVVYDPNVNAMQCEQAGVRKMELEELLQVSDFLSIHTPLTATTRGFINAERLRLMKRTAILINTSRGPVVEEKALLRALEDGWIAGAALDVLQNEPPEDIPFLDLKNVIVTPHAGFYSEEAVSELRSTAALEVKRVLTGQQPQHLVNPDVLKR